MTSTDGFSSIVVFDSNELGFPDESARIHIKDIAGGMQSPAETKTVAVEEKPSVLVLEEACKENTIPSSEVCLPCHFEFLF
jgi:hypothetical protein